MTTFLVELYAAQASSVDDLAKEARAAATEMRCQGIAVDYQRTIFVPEDETCLHVFAAASVHAIVEGSRRTSLRPGRVVAALMSSGRGMFPQSRGRTK